LAVTVGKCKPDYRKTVKALQSSTNDLQHSDILLSLVVLMHLLTSTGTSDSISQVSSSFSDCCDTAQIMIPLMLYYLEQHMAWEEATSDAPEKAQVNDSQPIN